MKTFWFLQAFLWSWAALAQPYSVDWWTSDGGGGTSAGGNYTVTGSAGQPDAQLAMTGGNYQLSGGFWFTGTSSSSSSAPTLHIGFISNVAVMFSWPGDQPGFVLQQTPSLNPPAWSDVSPEVPLTGGQYQFGYTMNSQVRFFRLIKR
jgi:hypothetical protein